MTMSTHALLRAQAEAYATERIEAIPELQSPVFDGLREVMLSEIRDAYVKGADAGLTSAKAEGREV
jgi:hypothetical protein